MLKELRTKRGLSQSQLAERSGVNLRTLQQYEQGTRNINGASLSTLVDLSKVLECKVKDILTDQELIKKMSHTM